MAQEFFISKADYQKLREENARMRSWLQGIIDYSPHEVCKDAFAYNRLMINMKHAARQGLNPPVEKARGE